MSNNNAFQELKKRLTFKFQRFRAEGADPTDRELADAPPPPRRRAPNKLIQACIALEHPPHDDWQLAPRRDASGLIDGQPISERITPSRPPESTWHDPNQGRYMNEGQSPHGTGLVHFDIDPQNILVGDLNIGPQEDHHGLVSVMKVGDFGDARKMDVVNFLN
ncbi:hypothetical protein C8A03DRAFT_37639, partial [Achaetomium macrosporum]